MTDEEIMQGLENACNSATGTFGWTVPPYPIVREYILKLQADNATLRARLKKSIELPELVMIDRTLVDGKFKPTQKAQAFNGRIGVVYRDETRWKGLLVDICSEKTFDYEPAKKRLAELQKEQK